MPRINIEDQWWDDPRRLELVELIGQYEADGFMVYCWRLAQTHYRNNSLIPEAIASRLKHLQALLSTGLAEWIKTERGNELYIKGSKEGFEWLDKKSEAGSIRSEAKKNQLIEARKRRWPNSKPNESENQNTSEQNQNTSEQNQDISEPLPLPLSITKVIGASETEDTPKESDNSSKQTSSGIGPAISAYREEFRARYGIDPVITKKDRDILAGFLFRTKAAAEIDALIRTFVRSDDKWFVTRGHDIGTFVDRINVVRALHAKKKKAAYVKL